MYCYNCGKELSDDDNFCSKCGCKVKKDAEETKNDVEQKVNESQTSFFNEPVQLKNVFVLVLLVVMVFVLTSSIYDYMAKVGSTIDLYDSNIPEITQKADKCTSPYVENEVLSIFKSNDPYLKYIDNKSIDTISIQDKETVYTEDNGTKNYCAGLVVVISGSKGFKPKNYDDSNNFYYQVYTNVDGTKITRYTNYKTPIMYTSQAINGKNYTEINDMRIGEFSCKGVCKTAYNRTNDSFAQQQTVEQKPDLSLKTEIKPEVIAPPQPVETEVNTVQEPDFKPVNTETKKKKFNFFRKNGE